MLLFIKTPALYSSNKPGELHYNNNNNNNNNRDTVQICIAPLGRNFRGAGNQIMLTTTTKCVTVCVYIWSGLVLTNEKNSTSIGDVAWST